MFIKTYQVEVTYSRPSKLGNMHEYKRMRSILVFRCDNCGELFERLKSKITPKRIGDSYFHCCNKCDSKRFAQRKGVERKQIWKKPASITDDISKL